MDNTDTEQEQPTIAESIARLHHMAMLLMSTVAAEMVERTLELPLLGGSDNPGPSPASKASIDAMPRIAVTEDRVKDCSICLEEIGVGGEIREMPCKHGFHSGCIEKWLGVHGSCPVCRYVMPVEEEDGSDDSDGSDEGRGRRQRGLLIDVLIVIPGRAGDGSDLAGSDGGLDNSDSTGR